MWYNFLKDKPVEGTVPSKTPTTPTTPANKSTTTAAILTNVTGLNSNLYWQAFLGSDLKFGDQDSYWPTQKLFQSSQTIEIQWKILCLAGILVIGGTGTGTGAQASVEFWSQNFSCSLKNYPRSMDWGSTVNLVLASLIGCFGFYCDIFQN